MKILVIEDEKDLLDAIVSYLHQGGYLCETAADYAEAKLKIALYEYSCVLADLNLPGGNGLELVRLIKENSPDTGIIIISARDALDDKVAGLDLGADDYLTKPFHLSELNARLKSVIRRRSFQGMKVIEINGLKVYPDAAEAAVGNHKLTLTKKEFDLLLFFISNKNRVLTKDSIAEHLWGDHTEFLDSLDFVYTHIKNLRRKLLDAGGEDYIQTVYGLGYKFNS